MYVEYEHVSNLYMEDEHVFQLCMKDELLFYLYKEDEYTDICDNNQSNVSFHPQQLILRHASGAYRYLNNHFKGIVHELT